MKKLINESVSRFLAWKLPADFAPDAGITFNPNANADSPIELQYKHEPTGTNLFYAGQAEAMLTHVFKPLIDKIEALESDLQIQTKVFIAACEDLALIAEKLGVDPEDGGASPILEKISKLEDLRKDAERYQWLRNENNWEEEGLCPIVANGEDTCYGGALDHAIDSRNKNRGEAR